MTDHLQRRTFLQALGVAAVTRAEAIPMATEFDDNVHYGLFFGGGALNSSTSFKVRMSELTLASLRASGLLDNMVDGLVPPVDTSMFWLDKNLDPAVLKEWDAVGAAWVQVTAQTLFGRLPFRGLWQSSPIYRVGDLVSDGFSIWIARLPSQNHPPAEDAYWDVFVDGGMFDARIASVSAAATITLPGTVKRALVEAYSPNYAVPATIAGAAHYKRVSSEPAHALKFRTLDRYLPNGSVSAGNGGWWEIDEAEISIEMAGATTDAADNKTAIDRAAAAAIALRRKLTVPGATYKTSGNHSWNNVVIQGEGMFSGAMLLCTNTAASTSILRLGAVSHISDLMLGYDAAVNIAGATSGQFVGLTCGTDAAFCKGASVRRVSFRHVGTPLYDQPFPTFSATFADIEARDFTYAMVDFTSNSRTQNVFFNLYGGRHSGGRNIAKYGMSFSGSDDTGMTLDCCNIESTKSDSAFRFVNCRAVTFTSFHTEDWVPTTTDCKLFDMDRSSVKIGRASIYYSVLKNDCALFGLGSAKYQEGSGTEQLVNNYLGIDVLSVKGLYSDEARTAKVTDSTGIQLFKRSVTEATDGMMFVDVKQYTPYYYFAGDATWYNSFAVSGDIIFTGKGQLRTYGVTANRPTLRRSNYVSRYYDTTANAELIQHPSLGWIPPQGNVKRIQSFTVSGTIEPETAVVVVKAESGNVVLTLPKTPGTALSRELTVRRTDNTANTVTFAAATGDTIGAVSIPGLGTKRLISDGFTTWLDV